MKGKRVQHDKHEEHNHIRRGKWVLAGFLAIAAFFLWTEHRAHLLGILPYLLILACPLMHIFHHHGHGHASPGAGSDALPPANRQDLP